MLTLVWELVRKDLRLFAADRKAMLISFVVPVAIASFLGSIFGNASSGIPAQKIAILVVDADRSAVSRDAVSKLSASSIVKTTLTDLTSAREAIRAGNAGVAVVFPKGFGESSVLAISGGPKPHVLTIVDPAHSIEAQSVRGVITQATMEAVIQQATGSATAATLPFEIDSQQETAPHSAEWSGVAHAFSGMAIQALLFWSIDSAMTMLRERRMGIWNRLRAAPVPSRFLLLGRLLSSAVRAFLILSVVLGFGMIVFGMRVQGSWLGLAALGLAAALMSASFGLFVAALGKTEAQSRGLTMLAVLVMTMLGGAWFPSFLMPRWVQTVSLAIPVRWAVDGLDAMTWRGASLGVAVTDAAVLLGFALVFAAIAFRRFRFEAE